MIGPGGSSTFRPMSTLGLATLLAVVACVIGGALGGFALARPLEALGMVGLRADEEKGHSLSEARATYGGLFLLSHAGTAAFLGYAPQIGACMAFALGFAWAGAAVGRVWSMTRDPGANGAFNVRATVFEMLMAATLSLPFWSYAGMLRGGAVLV